MKKILGGLAILCLAATAFAKTNNTLAVAVPFVGQYVNAPDHQGLTISYNLGAGRRKVVCSLLNFYKGWIDYKQSDVVHSTATYGGSEIVVLTSTEESKSLTESIDQYLVDRLGTATISNIENDNKYTALVSCAYMPESTQPH